MLEPLLENVGQRKSMFRKHAWNRSSGKHSPITVPTTPESPKGPPRRAPPPPPPQQDDPFEAEMIQLDVQISELENLKISVSRKIYELNAQKTDAVELEEYDLAKKCKLEIDSFEGTFSFFSHFFFPHTIYVFFFSIVPGDSHFFLTICIPKFFSFVPRRFFSHYFFIPP
jgi:hypothetical protein